MKEDIGLLVIDYDVNGKEGTGGISNADKTMLKSLREKGNTVLVVEHDKDIISIADEVIDIGPLAGKNGGQVLFQGSYESLLTSGTTITAKYLRKRGTPAVNTD